MVDGDPHISKLISRYVQGCSIIQEDSLVQITDAVNRYSPQGIIVTTPQYMAVSSQIMDLTIPIIVCSLPSTTEMAMKLGVTACLSKPILPQELIVSNHIR